MCRLVVVTAEAAEAGAPWVDRVVSHGARLNATLRFEPRFEGLGRTERVVGALVAEMERWLGAPSPDGGRVASLDLDVWTPCGGLGRLFGERGAPLPDGALGVVAAASVAPPLGHATNADLGVVALAWPAQSSPGLALGWVSGHTRRRRWSDRYAEVVVRQEGDRRVEGLDAA